MHDRELKHSAVLGKDRALNQSYLRLILALSIALLLHTLVAALLAAPLLSPEPDRTVRMQLVLQGVDTTRPSEPNVADIAAPAATVPRTVESAVESSQHTAEPALIDPEPPASAPDRVYTTRDTEVEAAEAPDPQPGPPAEPADNRANVPSTVSDKPEPDTPPANNPAGTPKHPSMASGPRGSDAPRSDAEVADQLTRIRTWDLPELDPYSEALLAEITESVDSSIIRGLDTLDRVNQAIKDGPRKIVIELWLLENGAVRRVRLVRKSGDEWIDRVVERAALASSPYPPPPAEKRRDNFRFQLPLIITLPDLP